MLCPRQHRLKFAHFRYFQVPTHYHLDHAFAQAEKIWCLKQGKASGLDKSQNHIYKLWGWRIAPVVIFQRHKHGANDVDPKELLGMMKARLQKLGQVVVLGGAYQPRNRLTCHGERLNKCNKRNFITYMWAGNFRNVNNLIALEMCRDQIR